MPIQIFRDVSAQKFKTVHLFHNMTALVPILNTHFSPIMWKLCSMLGTRRTKTIVDSVGDSVDEVGDGMGVASEEAHSTIE